MHKEDLASYVLSRYEIFQNARSEVEDSWLECWAKYLNTPETEGYLKSSALKRVGDVEVNWRHRLSSGKAYEAVETVLGYLMSATFPNRDWFGVEPVVPAAVDEDNLQVARLIKKHLTNKLDESGFKSQWATFLRVLTITGTAVMAIPWRTEYNNRRVRSKTVDPATGEETYIAEEVAYNVYDAPKLEVLSNFDVYVDPTVGDPNEGDFIRKFTKTKAELLQLIDEGVYDFPKEDVLKISSDNGWDLSNTHKHTLKTFEGIDTQPWSPSELVELIEFWGDVYDNETGECIKDQVVTLLNGEVIAWEDNPFWCGKPFIIGTYSKTGNSPYGFGGVQPVLGMLHELDIVTNQRLDNLELAINNMWTLRSDGVLQPEEVYTEPGRVLLVGDHGDLQPLTQQNQAWAVTYQEAGLLEQSIDKSFGTGNYISSNQQRSGERVTATEVAAVREAGGNRLSTVHKHIEETALIPFLAKLFSLVQQFTIAPVTVRVAGDGADEYNYFELEPTDLNMQVKLRPVGSDNVIERREYVQSRLEFVQSISGIPEVAAKLNMDKFLTDLLNHWGFDDPDAYLKKESPQQEKVLPTPTSGNPLVDAVSSGELPNVGMANAIQSQLGADGGMGMMNQLMAGTGLAPNTTVEGQAGLQDELSASNAGIPPTAATVPGGVATPQ